MPTLSQGDLPWAAKENFGEEGGELADNYVDRRSSDVRAPTYGVMLSVAKPTAHECVDVMMKSYCSVIYMVGYLDQKGRSSWAKLG